MELAPKEKGVETTSPLINYNTSERQFGFSWFNTALHLYGDYDNYAVYFDGEDKCELKLPEPLWDKLLSDGQRFPFSYFPARAAEKHWHHPQGLADSFRLEQYEPMTIEYPGGEAYDLRWNNTVMRCFGEKDYNHLEVRVPRDDGGFEVRGMFINEGVWQHLFENDYPLIYFPTIDMDDVTKKWYVAHRSGELDKGDA